MKLYRPKNRVSDTLASSFAHGTDTSLTLNDASTFPSPNGYILVDDDNEWAVYEYSGISSNTLENLSLADPENESVASHTFSSGSDVYLIQSADIISDLIDVSLVNFMKMPTNGVV